MSALRRRKRVLPGATTASSKAITFAKTFPSGRMDLREQNKHTGDLSDESQGLRLVSLK